VLVLLSVAEVLVTVKVGATGSVVRISRGDVVDDLAGSEDVCLVLLADLVVDTLVDRVAEGLRLDNDVGSVTSVDGRETDDRDCLGIAVGIVVLLVFDAGGNVIGPVPVIGTARVAVMTEWVGEMAPGWPKHMKKALSITASVQPAVSFGFSSCIRNLALPLATC
jgi:hypothetical protein